ncbi:hypothetical protein [Providencia rettgeri]|uniref:hypothetical protein n=1 Tax=Providencia rettgeri TaxID=587 RepID=UPI00235E6458|nr:hypothetical protein [Providencia rettgeri]
MCDPIYAGAAILASSGMQAYSQYQSGKFNADVANQNARQNEQAANDSINRGNAEAEKQRSRTRQLAGSQAAVMSASGLDLSSAGALDMFGDTAAMGTLDSLTLVNNSQREAYGLRMQAASDRLNAKMSRREGNFGAMTTLLTAPIKAYGAYQLAGGKWNPFTGEDNPATKVDMFKYGFIGAR